MSQAPQPPVRPDLAKVRYPGLLEISFATLINAAAIYYWIQGGSWSGMSRHGKAITVAAVGGTVLLLLKTWAVAGVKKRLASNPPDNTGV